MPTPTSGSNLIDVHGHIGALGLPTPRLRPREQVAEMAKYGIVHTFASSLRAIADDLAVGNAEAFDAVGDGLQAYVVVNPNDLEGSCAAMDDAFAREVAVGAKLHCGYSGQPTASRACSTLMREVARRGRPLKIHVDGVGWDDALASIAAEYPRWKVIVAHAGPGTPARESACLGSNVYLELSTSFPDLPIAREVVRAVGPVRLLFGSDAPLLEPAYVLGLYADAGADLAATSDVAREVFGL